MEIGVQINLLSERYGVKVIVFENEAIIIIKLDLSENNLQGDLLQWKNIQYLTQLTYLYLRGNVEGDLSKESSFHFCFKIGACRVYFFGGQS